MTAIIPRARSVLLAALLVLAAIVVPSTIAAPKAHAAACLSTDKFTGSVAWMEHVLNCNHIPYVQYTMSGSTATPGKVLSVESFNQPKTATPNAGGPSCQWLYKAHLAKLCSHGSGQKSIECLQWWSGSYYPYHCGPVEAYNKSHSESMLSVVKGAFKNHYLRACVRGSVIGSPTAVMLKVAGAATGIGVMLTVAGGCVGGELSYWWKAP